MCVVYGVVVAVAVVVVVAAAAAFFYYYYFVSYYSTLYFYVPLFFPFVSLVYRFDALHAGSSCIKFTPITVIFEMVLIVLLFFRPTTNTCARRTERRAKPAAESERASERAHASSVQYETHWGMYSHFKHFYLLKINKNYKRAFDSIERPNIVLQLYG